MDYQKTKFLIEALDRVVDTFPSTKEFIDNTVTEICSREKVMVEQVILFVLVLLTVAFVCICYIFLLLCYGLLCVVVTNQKVK